MSGFAAAISTDGAPPDGNLLERMTAKLAFRGPDAINTVAQGGAAFCFTFMSTGPAPQAASQPCTIDGKVWLVGDVRLDGRGELRRKLEQFGHTFAAGVTDEELVLHAWQQWGEAGLPELLGDYSFGLWDSETRRLWCVRDLMGARPFFYAWANGCLYFSNTLDAIRCVKEISSELDLHYIGDFLLAGSCHYPERTVFRDVSRLPAGYMLRFSGQALEVSQFTSMPIEEPLWLNREEEYVERFGVLLEQAVRERLPRGPAAIFMSGGLDSTGVAAVAVDVARKNDEPLDLRAYTMDWNPLFKDPEGELATLAANFIAIPIEILNCSGYLPFGGWENSPPPLPEPFHEPFRTIYIDQMRQISKHARVVFNGYGGDGVLTGQSWPYLVDLFRRGRLATIASSFGAYTLRHRRIPPLRGGFRSRLLKFVNRSDPFANYPTWFRPDVEENFGLRSRWLELHKPFQKHHPWYPEAYDTLAGPYWSTVSEPDDAAWSGVAVESRSPLLDIRVQRFLLCVPPVPLCMDKQILRRALHGLLPREICARHKTPLTGDAVKHHLINRTWAPEARYEPTPEVRSAVDWEKFEKGAGVLGYSFPWTDLRPICLLYWRSSR